MGGDRPGPLLLFKPRQPLLYFGDLDGPDVSLYERAQLSGFRRGRLTGGDGLKQRGRGRDHVGGALDRRQGKQNGAIYSGWNGRALFIIHGEVRFFCIDRGNITDFTDQTDRSPWGAYDGFLIFSQEAHRPERRARSRRLEMPPSSPPGRHA